MVPACEKLLAALRAADQAAEETSSGAGPFLVQSLHNVTRHPKLTEVFPGGFLLVTERSLPDEDQCVQEELDGIRLDLPTPPGLCEEPTAVEHCITFSTRNGASDGNAEQPRFEKMILEERLEPIEIGIGRLILSAVSRHKVHLRLPLMILVKEENDAEEVTERALSLQSGSRRGGARTVYMGVRTQPARNDENAPPGSGSGGFHVFESIRVQRPFLPATSEPVVVGDLLRLLRGAATGADVHMSTRHDLYVGAVQVSSWTSHLPAQLIPGAFLSLVMSWSMSMQQASSATLFHHPSALGCSSAVYMRPSRSIDRSLLSRHLMDLHVLNHLKRGAASSEVLQCSEREGILSGEDEILDAINHFLEEEGRIATSAALHPSKDSLHPHGSSALAALGDGAAVDGEDEERPGRDFVDRLWLEVLSRCNTVSCLSLAIGAALTELGRRGGLVPHVRRENGTELAELVRMAVKISSLQSYGGPSDAETLKDLRSSWEHKIEGVSKNCVPLVLGAGMECLRRDLMHIVMRHGYITMQDLGHFSDESSADVTPRIQRLTCLRHIAELALMCTRHRLCFDSMRHLVLKAIEYYKRPSNTDSDRSNFVPVFSVPLSNTSSARLLSTFPSLDPSSCVIECGGSSIRVKRALAQTTAMDDGEETASASELGSWRRSRGSPFEYNVTLFDRYRYVK
eukprot:gnl/TRDRNA2_/TRDRNA2_44918_c0_seq1.p1 gnl/TRDRNA2_/TRDRNA2_44918_c0~~gnl/TRDRNA2_/TRDRNA2_44918_c0_seq1.p1  ORF type:complete len:684 (+),score=99.69 gnl/TRDRNA2_/TRDRNA2_44918_c0_seq1:51-2102(+)